MSFTFDAPRMQIFSFPPDIVYRLWQKPSTFKVALKLYQTCKYFYYKRNAVFFGRLCYRNKYLKTSIKPFDKLNDSIVCYANELIVKAYYQKIMPKMPRFHNIISLEIHSSSLKFKDFEILTANSCIEKFKFRCTFLTYSDGSFVTIDTILEKLPNVKYFKYESYDVCSVETLENLNKLKFTNKFLLFNIRIGRISEDFNPILLSKFIENNMNHSGEIKIWGWCLDRIKGKILVQEILKFWDSWEDKDHLSKLKFSGSLKFY